MNNKIFHNLSAAVAAGLALPYSKILKTREFSTQNKMNRLFAGKKRAVAELFILQQLHRLVLGGVSFCGQILHLPQNFQLNGDCESKGQNVGKGLGDLHAEKFKTKGENQNQGNEEQALAGDGQEGGRYHHADGLCHHIAHDDPAHQEICGTLEAEGSCTVFNNLRIVPEQSDQLRGKDGPKNADGNQK